MNKGVRLIAGLASSVFKAKAPFYSQFQKLSFGLRPRLATLTKIGKFTA
jgi:hypothetical protein